jgi:hypothetical protein
MNKNFVLRTLLEFYEGTAYLDERFLGYLMTLFQLQWLCSVGFVFISCLVYLTTLSVAQTV